ncbi:SMI1/KNR4 family protein [Streptomyces sp. NPDC086783]|uniref:SMI1/KNR4 family protein n=1 Tax=Streptomyces sp. NPDC086783 TaxID=3365758 RepID=UPI0038133923
MARFEDLRQLLWDPDSSCGVQLPLTRQAIAQAEDRLGVVLPGALLDLLRTRNGGQIADDWNAFPTSGATSWSADHVPFDSMMGIGHREEALSMLDSPYLVAEWGLPANVVTFSGDGHWWIGLDYRAGGGHGEPSVTWFDADDGTELPLAPDFRSFVEGLTSAGRFESDEPA